MSVGVTKSAHMDYPGFLATKHVATEIRGTDDISENPGWLHDWQYKIAKWCLRGGSRAIFADTGLGKTRMEIFFAMEVARVAGKPCLIIAPLGVGDQTIREAKSLGVEIGEALESNAPIQVINYESLHKLDVSIYGGVVLDESSILKSYTGATKQTLIETFAGFRFKLAATATPAPNDYMEIGNHSQFLEVMSSSEMLSRFFIADQADTGHYRLKGHAVEAFWEWIASWAACLQLPSDLGYSDEGYILPGLKVHTQIVDDGRDYIFGGHTNSSATTVHKQRRESVNVRANEAATILAQGEGPCVIWCDTDYDVDAVKQAIPEAVEIGRDKHADRKQKLKQFSDGEIRVIVTKPKMFGFGMNWQHCNRCIFVGPSFSFEILYQAIRRFHRYGQTKVVNVHLVGTPADESVLTTLHQKAMRHESFHEGVKKAAGYLKLEPTQINLSAVKTDVQEGDGWKVYLGDSCQEMGKLEDDSIHLSVFSPPFSNLYIYSDSEADLGNSATHEEFLEHFGFIVSELYRVTKPGRMACVHCKDLPRYKGRDSEAGLYDFPGDLIRLFAVHGFSFHSRVTIWKCPVTEMTRTKAHGLLYKQLRADSTYSRQGMADYVLMFRKWADEDVEPVTHTYDSFPLDQWQQYASPVWMDIKQQNVLNTEIARESQDEKHICPLQLDVIERLVTMYSNKGDLVFSPFTGIGSEGVVSLQLDRRFVGIELKEAYWKRACQNLKEAKAQGVLAL